MNPRRLRLRASSGYGAVIAIPTRTCRSRGRLLCGSRLTVGAKEQAPVESERFDQRLNIVRVACHGLPFSAHTVEHTSSVKQVDMTRLFLALVWALVCAC